MASLAGTKVGDLVGCDVRGVRFVAEVTGVGQGELEVAPINKVGYHRVSARQVEVRWKRLGKGSGSRWRL